MTEMERRYRDNETGGGIPPEVKAKRKEIKWRTKIFVCSPYRPVSTNPKVASHERTDNIIRAQLACRLVTAIGCQPLCPHLYCTAYLDDDRPAEREQGLEFARDWLLEADAIWIFGDEISEGMQAEIDTAARWDIPIRYLPEPAVMITDLMNSFRGSDYVKRWVNHPEETDEEVYRKVVLGEEG